MAAALACGGCGRIAFDSADVPAARSTLYLDRAAPAESLSDFALPIVLDETRADLTLLSAETLRAFAGSTELDVEIESPGPPLVAWIRVPSIESTTTRITIEYGDAQRSRNNVWDASYLGVWHMATHGDDSSSFAHVSQRTAVGKTDGRIGAGVRFTLAQQSCMTVPSFASLAASQLTLTGWIRVATSPGLWYGLMSRQSSDDINDDFFLAVTPTLNVQGAGTTTNGGAWSLFSTGQVAVGDWHHLAQTYANGVATLYLDGTIVETASILPDALRASSRPLFIGCGRNGSGTPIDQPDSEFFDGILDEVRVESVARSQAWLAYSVLAHSDSVITYGPVEY